MTAASWADRFVRQRAAAPADTTAPAEPPSGPSPSDKTVAALVGAELDRRAAQAAADELAAVRRRCTGGPCHGCGQTVSWVWQEYSGEGGEAAVSRQLVPKWTSAFGGQLCYECSVDRGTSVSVDDFRGWVARCLLGGEGRYWLPQALGVRLRGVPILWAEHDPRPPTRDSEAPLTERFGFVDVAAIVDALRPPPPDYRDGPQCPRCGTADRWVRHPGGPDVRRFPDGLVNVDVPPHLVCDGCGYRRAIAGSSPREGGVRLDTTRLYPPPG